MYANKLSSIIEVNTINKSKYSNNVYLFFVEASFTSSLDHKEEMMNQNEASENIRNENRSKNENNFT